MPIDAPRYRNPTDSPRRNLAHQRRAAHLPVVGVGCIHGSDIASTSQRVSALVLYDSEQAESERLHPPELTSARPDAIGLLRDLQDLYQLANLV